MDDDMTKYDWILIFIWGIVFLEILLWLSVI
jgi:hypothetical protein